MALTELSESVLYQVAARKMDSAYRSLPGRSNIGIEQFLDPAIEVRNKFECQFQRWVLAVPLDCVYCLT